MYGFFKFIVYRNTTPKYISCCMKFVIKDHLEMIPDILSVIEKMTKDEGNFYNYIKCLL